LGQLQDSIVLLQTLAVTIGNDDIFSGTMICSIPRANVTLDYYNFKQPQINIVAIGFSPGDDLLLLRFLQPLEKANYQVVKINTRTLSKIYSLSNNIVL
ncbi:unnamed protein product, partial [Rotaria sp. Silwood1]